MNFSPKRNKYTLDVRVRHPGKKKEEENDNQIKFDKQVEQIELGSEVTLELFLALNI